MYLETAPFSTTLIHPPPPPLSATPLSLVGYQRFLSTVKLSYVKKNCHFTKLSSQTLLDYTSSSITWRICASTHLQYCYIEVCPSCKYERFPVLGDRQDLGRTGESISTTALQERKKHNSYPSVDNEHRSWFSIETNF